MISLLLFLFVSTPSVNCLGGQCTAQLRISITILNTHKATTSINQIDPTLSGVYRFNVSEQSTGKGINPVNLEDILVIDDWLKLKNQEITVILLPDGGYNIIYPQDVVAYNWPSGQSETQVAMAIKATKILPTEYAARLVKKKKTNLGRRN